MHFSSSETRLRPSFLDRWRYLTEMHLAIPINWWPLPPVLYKCPIGSMRLHWQVGGWIVQSFSAHRIPFSGAATNSTSICLLLPYMLIGINHASLFLHSLRQMIFSLGSSRQHRLYTESQPHKTIGWHMPRAWQASFRFGIGPQTTTLLLRQQYQVPASVKTWLGKYIGALTRHGASRLRLGCASRIVTPWRMTPIFVKD